MKSRLACYKIVTMINLVLWIILSTRTALAVTCYDFPQDLRMIERHVNTHKKSSQKYQAYKTLLKNSSDQELMARLTYAEVLAAHCPQFNSYIIQPIATVIWNRHRTSKKSLREVIFSKDQFASSLNIYKESRYKDFLCPKDHALWKDVQSHVEQITQGTKPLFEPTVVHYYLFLHSPRLKPPAWAQGAQRYPPANWNDGQKYLPCIEFFKSGPL